MRKMSRRRFIRVCISAAAAGFLLRNPYRLVAGGGTRKWEMPDQGRIRFIKGEVYVNDIRAVIGDTVNQDDRIRTDEKSEAEIELQDFAVFSIKENTTCSVRDLFTKPTLELEKGWCLLIVRHGKPFSISTPTVLAGIRGTVIFFRVFDREHTYMCDCYGSVDLIDPDTGDVLRQVTSRYHKAVEIRKTGRHITVERQRKLYHRDRDILQISEGFSRETRVFEEKEGRGSNY